MSEKPPFREAIRAARKKQEERKKSRPARVPGEPKKNPRHDWRKDGEPTTSALELWGPLEYLREFEDQAKKSFPDYTPAAKTHEIKCIKAFLEMLDENEACPRSKLAVVREAAKRLVRYKKNLEIKTQPGVWWLLTYGIAILDDLKHLIYTDGTLRYLMTEDVPVDLIDMLHITRRDECWVFSYKGQEVQIHESQWSSITNPHLQKRLNIAPSEERPDNENYSGW